MLISDEWRALNRELHEIREDFGSKTVPARVEAVKKYAHKLDARRILDYGCGKGALVRESGFRFQVTGYDPAVPEFDSEPSPADMVVCWDVLEHVEPQFLDGVLDHIRSLARRGVHLIVATRADSTKLMPDGRNPHLIVEPVEWWLPKLRSRWADFAGRFDTGELEFRGASR